VLFRGSQNRRTGWVTETLEAEVGQFLLRCKCSVSRGIVVQEQDQFGEFLVVFFLQSVLQLHQQRWVILRVDSFWCRIHLRFRWMGVCKQNRWRHSVTEPHTRWRIGVTMATLWQQQDGGYILHLQQYSRRLNLLLLFFSPLYCLLTQLAIFLID